MPSANLGGFPLPPPDNTGSLDISGVAPVNTGSVGIAEAIAKARGIAAEKGIAQEQSRGITYLHSFLVFPEALLTRGFLPGFSSFPLGPQRGIDLRRDSRPYHRSRSPSRSPPRVTRETYRDNYNPYREERRVDRHNVNDRGYARERSFSPRPANRGKSTYSPPSSRRYWGDDRSPPGRRVADGGGGMEDNYESINIEAHLVGLIIGRQGENLRRIESDTQTRIQFLETDPSGLLRLCKITGNKIARDDAKDEISRMINEHRGMSSRPGPGFSERPGRPAQQGSIRENDDAMQIMVPDRTVGLIIGRGGETIRDLQERSGCHVSIVGEHKSVNGLRPVNLVGSDGAKSMAKDFILEIVESDTRQLANPPQREPRAAPTGDTYGGQSDRTSDTLMIPSDAVGMIIGKGKCMELVLPFDLSLTSCL